jgi:transcriptional regulator with XRE-family HTH domain
MKEDGVMQNVFDLQPKAMIGHKLTDFMNANPELSTTELGHFLGVTQSMVSKLRHDKSPLHFDDLANLFKSTEGLLGADEFKISVLNKFTNGFIPPLPNYYYVSTNLAALSNRVITEMGQSMDALKEALDDFSDPSSPNNIKNISDPEQAFAQCYDVLYYLLLLMAIIANTYGLSWIDEGRKRVKEIAQHHERQI